MLGLQLTGEAFIKQTCKLFFFFFFSLAPDCLFVLFSDISVAALAVSYAIPGDDH